jgi:hypothetical protein
MPTVLTLSFTTRFVVSFLVKMTKVKTAQKACATLGEQPTADKVSSW